MNLLDMSDLALETIFGYLPYHEIAEKRLVCHKIDMTCQSLLNRGLVKLTKRLSDSRDKKALLARMQKRFSLKRKHPFYQNVLLLDILQFSMRTLSGMYSKYIKMNACCFVPGKIIDEVWNMIRLANAAPMSNHTDIARELIDLQIMAIEHFHETMKPRLDRLEADKKKNDSSNSKAPIFQCDDGFSYRSEYVRLSKKYKVVMRKLNHVTNKVEDLSCRMEELERTAAINNVSGQAPPMKKHRE